jgi:hypothetical protein
MSRRARITLFSIGIVVVVVIGLVLTLILVPGQNERTEVVGLIRAQLRGDQAAMLSKLKGCQSRPNCVADVGFDALKLRQPGSVEVLNFIPSSTLALGGNGGDARIAWRAGANTTEVQCVVLHRDSGLFGARHVTLVAISRPIPSQSACPGNSG